MLMFPASLRSSLELAAGLLVSDVVAAYILSFFHIAFVESFGDIMLVEIAVLFILAGVIDFASSIGAAQFRKALLGARQAYSPSKHKASRRSASVLLGAGLILLAILILAAIYD
jgi:hypothetical protein